MATPRLWRFWWIWRNDPTMKGKIGFAFDIFLHSILIVNRDDVDNKMNLEIARLEAKQAEGRREREEGKMEERDRERKREERRDQLDRQERGEKREQEREKREEKREQEREKKEERKLQQQQQLFQSAI